MRRAVTGSTFELRDAGNTLVPAAVTYNAGTTTATLTPNSALAGSASLATVKGGTGAGQGCGRQRPGRRCRLDLRAQRRPEPALHDLAGHATPTKAASSDNEAVELGVKFQPNANGYITGMRFYKGAATRARTWASCGAGAATSEGDLYQRDWLRLATS